MAFKRKKYHQNTSPRYLFYHKYYILQNKKNFILGSGESGKTTIIKQMKILHIKGFSHRLENFFEN